MKNSSNFSVDDYVYAVKCAIEIKSMTFEEALEKYVPPALHDAVRQRAEEWDAANCDL